ncbi:MAG: nicotinate-nicotinamide nucleotide adenylyltransferase [Phycisphaerales bacterium]|nr:nicotinate-nicotinamide nucleotide adenylyltransferase [Phycisphaerales bacterium]
MPDHGQPDPVLNRPKLLFFGGSFDPVHAGHTTLALAAARSRWGEGGGWGVVFVPAARSPHKDADPTPDAHRLAMLRTAIGGHPDMTIWTHELEQPDGPSYWADTWAVARKEFAHAECRFLIGADQARAMNRWSRYRAFWRDALVVLRGEDDSPNDLLAGIQAAHAWSAADLADWESMIVRTGLVDVSSTAIRATLADDAQRKTRIEGLDPGVQEYILKHGLYR